MPTVTDLAAKIGMIFFAIAGVVLLGSSTQLELNRSLAGIGCLLIVVIARLGQIHDEMKVQTELLAEISLTEDA